VTSFDNEQGKGDHNHIEDEGCAHAFASIDRLTEDFIAGGE